MLRDAGMVASAIVWISGSIERYTVRHVVSSWRAKPHARTVNKARGGATWSCCSVNNPNRARRLLTLPGALAPHDLHRPAERRGVDQPHGPAGVARSDHPARSAALLGPGRLHHHH